MLQANITSGSAEISLTHSQVIMDRMDGTPSREFLPEINIYDIFKCSSPLNALI